jgi:hypothetical protein
LDTRKLFEIFWCSLNLIYALTLKSSCNLLWNLYFQQWIIKQSRIVLEAHIVEAVKQYIYRFCLLQQSYWWSNKRCKAPPFYSILIDFNNTNNAKLERSSAIDARESLMIHCCIFWIIPVYLRLDIKPLMKQNVHAHSKKW